MSGRVDSDQMMHCLASDLGLHSVCSGLMSQYLGLISNFYIILDKRVIQINTSQKHIYIILIPLNPTFI